MLIETKFLIREKDRRGNVRVYYRKKPGRRIRIRAEEGTPEFLHAYILAAQGQSADGKPLRVENPRVLPPANGTLRDLIVRYYKAPEFHQELDERTQRVRKLILDKLCLDKKKEGQPTYGEWPVARIDVKHIREIRDKHSNRPEAANGIIKALRQVFAYGIDDEFPGLKMNPARDVKYLKSKGDGHHSWTIEEVEKFEERHPIGTMARLALALLLYTGQRRSDVVRFGPANVKNGWLTFTQFKNRNSKPISLAIPILPELQNIIDKTKGTGEAFLMNELGKPFTADGFGNWFRDRCIEVTDENGVQLIPGRAHGLRKAAAARLAELGCSDREIMAITGHTTSKEVDRYTKGARQRVLAASAMKKMAGNRHLKVV